MAENEINARVSNIRLRTWSLTIILVICLPNYENTIWYTIQHRTLAKDISTH